MQRNLIQCPHCQKRFTRLTEETPIVNRSDGMRFHVTLFAGPDPRTRSSGGSYKEQVICHFAYAHDQFGPKEHTVSVFIIHAEEVPRQIEDAVEQLAQLVEEGHRLTAVYTFQDRILTPGFPI